MNCLREVGGFLSYVSDENKIYDRYTLLNLGRSCLRYFIESHEIKYMYVSYYTCPVVWQAVEDSQCKILPYDIDDNFMPENINDNAAILYTNYFGICGRKAKVMAGEHRFVIIDNAQAFYSNIRAKGAIYSPRKFFALPDGGLLWPKMDLPANISTDISWDRCTHILKRADLGAEAAYEDFKDNEKRLGTLQPMKMSRLTETLLANIDFDYAREIRLKNFAYLHNVLRNTNLLKIELEDDDVPMVYPYKTSDYSLREKLISKKIFVAKYWPQDKGSQCMTSERSRELAESIIPLPIDQRYGLDDMRRVLDVING